MENEVCPLCAAGKSTHRSESEKKSLINRLSRISGQIAGIRNMIEEDRYCVDVLMQCSAVSSALESLEREILSAHLRGCVKKDIAEGRDEVLDETMKIIERMMR